MTLPRAASRDLVAASYLKGDFVLRSGKRSNRYFDKFLFETDPHLLERIGAQLALLVPRETERLAAPELGAVALAASASKVGGQAVPKRRTASRRLLLVRLRSERWRASRMADL